MTFSCVAPSPSLRGFVRDYLIAHFVFDQEQPIPVKPYAPKPEQGISFFVKGSPRMQHPQSGQVHAAPPTSIFGQQISRCDVHLGSEFLMFRVHFQPGALFRLLNVPLHELTGDYINAELLLSREVRDVHERLAAARSYPEMVVAVESFLSGRVGNAKKDEHAIDRATAYLMADPTRFSLDWMADQACLSPRQFSRRFTERMGVGPKFYSRLIRFYLAYRYKEVNPAIDWFTVAVRFGYTDYQHMAKDFAQFTQGTPNTWLREDSASPEKVLNLCAS